MVVSSREFNPTRIPIRSGPAQVAAADHATKTHDTGISTNAETGRQAQASGNSMTETITASNGTISVHLTGSERVPDTEESDRSPGIDWDLTIILKIGADGPVGEIGSTEKSTSPPVSLSHSLENGRGFHSRRLEDFRFHP
jgi:hypothetical protein